MTGVVIWTIFDHPRDFPDYYVARAAEITKGGGIVSSPNALLATDIETLRKAMRGLCLNCIERHPTDDPKIVESWL